MRWGQGYEVHVSKFVVRLGEVLLMMSLEVLVAKEERVCSIKNIHETMGCGPRFLYMSVRLFGSE